MEVVVAGEEAAGEEAVVEEAAVGEEAVAILVVVTKANVEAQQKVFQAMQKKQQHLELAHMLATKYPIRYIRHYLVLSIKRIINSISYF